jgi:UDP-N-acetylmuramate: L-alanyl-gamma-D-glutamyl-meso-diaminopimelate ligase
MKMGTWKDSLAESIKVADLVFCYTSDLGWDVQEALQPLGSRVVNSDNLEQLIEAITIATRPGDYVLIMSNGGFGGIHKKLLKSLSASH